MLSPTTGRPIIKLSEQDAPIFKKIKNSLRSKKFASSPPLNTRGLQKNLNKLAAAQKELVRAKEQIEVNECITHKPVEKATTFDSSLEEGEIQIEMDGDDSPRNTEVMSDEDCVCLEEEVDSITIDEDDSDYETVFFKDTSKRAKVIDLTPGTRTYKSDPGYYGAHGLNGENDDVIVLDDTIDVDVDSPTPAARGNAMEQSVLFISESLPDYIPLVSDDVPKPIKRVANPVAPKRQRHSNSLFNSSEKKQLQAYNVNAYNPNAIEDKQLRSKNPKRMVIIDGSNIAHAHNRNGVFSVKGLQIAIEYFIKMGHEVKAVIPLWRTHRMKSTDPAALEKLHKEGFIVLTPCKNLPGKCSSSYDDRFILQLASELDAAVVSNDNYRDLINENTAFKKLIENRVIGYTWCDDVFILPKDPYGKFGPTLHSILNREVVPDKS